MKRTRVIKRFKKLHKWPALIIAFIAILFATSGIVMNHRPLFSSVDISRKLLPGNYSYRNWNLASVRGSLNTNNADFIFGNIGIWKSTDDFSTFKDFNQGFPKGIDKRKIYSLILFNSKLIAGTHMGLYKRTAENGKWEKVPLQLRKERITDIALKGDTLLVLTRDYLLKSADGINFKRIQLPEPVNYVCKTGLFDTFWQLHSGELFGLPGKLVVDLLGVVTLVLSITGILHFFSPGVLRRRKRKQKNTNALAAVKKLNLRWHNVLGYVFVFFLMVNTFAGIHLRPPLLIAIANKQVGIIPGTHLDSPNPWFDKLRRVYWDEKQQRYLFSTKEGFFWADESLSEKLMPAPMQPPVSVMGCNVLKPVGEKHLLVGSFSGMFLWNTENGRVSDFFTGLPYHPQAGMARPIGANAVAGFAQNDKKSWWFDYSRGAIEMNTKQTTTTFPPMTDEIKTASPMSLWNVSLEIHTGRIFEHLVGDFYILFVPLAGICMLLVLISGFFIWWMVYRNGRKKKA